MFLSRFGVKNYKCLGEIDIPLTPIHVLIGQNDAGKTSLLEAIDAFCRVVAVGPMDAFAQPWSGRDLVFHGTPRAEVAFLGEWSASSGDGGVRSDSRFGYRVSVEFDEYGGQCSIAGDDISVDGRSLHTSFDSAGNMGKPTEVQEFDDQARWAIRGWFQPPHKYALDAKLMAVPATIDPKRRLRLDPDGFGLATLLDDILGLDPQRFLDIRTEFCKYFPQFKSLRIESENSLERRFIPTGIHTSREKIGKGISFETQGGGIVRAQQTSDGAILFLGFLTLAHLPEPPNLLLIEEPENGVYPKRLGEVIRLLKEMVDREDGVRFPQIIISTHSPYVLSFFEPEEVTFLSRPADDPAGPVRARPLRDAPDIHERMGDGFYLGELWYNLSEKELFRDA